MKKIVKIAVAVMAIFAMTNFIACSTGGDSEGNTETEAGTGGSTGGTTGGETGGSTGGTTGGETGGSTGGTTGGETGGSTGEVKPVAGEYKVVYGDVVLIPGLTLEEANAWATECNLVKDTDYTINETAKTITLTAAGMAKVEAAGGEGDHDHTGEGGETGGEGDHDHTGAGGEGGETGGEGEEPPIVITNPITLDFEALKKEIVAANLFTDSTKLTEDKTYVTSGVTLNFLASSKYAFKYNQDVGLTIKGDVFKITGIEGTYSAVVTWAIAGAKPAGDRTLSVNNGTPVGNADTQGAASATSIDNLCTVENATGDLTFNASNEVVIKTIVITKI